MTKYEKSNTMLSNYVNSGIILKRSEIMERVNETDGKKRGLAIYNFMINNNIAIKCPSCSGNRYPVHKPPDLTMPKFA